MQDLTAQLSALVGSAFAAAGFETSHGVVRRSDRPDLGDFQCNGAMSAAKPAGKNPRDVAGQIIAALKDNTLFADVSIAGPGFINLKLTDAAVAAHAQAMAATPDTGFDKTPAPQKVFVDFGGPNMAKPMHVGHLRATIIGDSVQRIARFMGHKVTSDAHFGDWGLQIGLLISALQDEQPDLPYYRDDYTDSMDLPAPPVTLEDLERLYPAASARMKEDETYRERARKATAEMQAGKPGYRALHRQLWNASKPALEREFGLLGIHFDLWLGESDVDHLIAPMIAELEAKKIAVPDDGAIVIRVARNSDKAEIPPFLLVSSEGSAMYGTTDLATIIDRKTKFDPDLYLYCVDQRQALHFTQVFRSAVLAGYGREEQFEHIANGTMNGADGKPFKTRAGGVIKLYDLITTARGKALERLTEAGLGADLSDDELQKVALSIGTAALKFADLSNFRLTNYIFDFDRFVTFEGKTGPYLQYQGVRIKSLLRKATDQNITAGPIALTLPEERALVLILDAFISAVHVAWDKRAPHFIAEHAYSLAQAFSSFYAAAPILPETDKSSQASRLQLAILTLDQLQLALGLLGIEIPARM